MLALGAALAARGHDVCLQTWRRWSADVEAAGMRFAPAPEYQVFPTPGRALQPYVAAVRAARDTVPLVEALRPDACVADVLTIAPALAAELCGVPWATLVPHLLPAGGPGFPVYSIGARLPRTPVGRALWRLGDRPVRRGLEQGRREYNESRRRLGLPPVSWVNTGLSRSRTLVATLPQLEYPREWPPWARVVGPLLWEPPGERVAPPPGDGPVVLVAPSTSQDPGQTLVRAALEGLARERVRVLAIGTPGDGERPLPAPANARVVPWMSYARTMPACDVVVTHGGHGTLARALTVGCRVVVCPAGGDMAENAARVAWAGVGVRVPRRFLSPAAIRLAVRRALSDPRLTARAAEIAGWSARHDAPATAACEVERWVSAGAPPATARSG